MFTIYHADCIGQANNCLYPHSVEITDAGIPYQGCQSRLCLCCLRRQLPQ